MQIDLPDTTAGLPGTSFELVEQGRQTVPTDQRDVTPTPAGDEIAFTRVAWIASTYGFGHDLAYYRQVFGEFVSRFPKTVIHVTEGYPVERYPDLPLKADFQFVMAEQRRTVGKGVPYKAWLLIPTPATILRILRDNARVFVIIEFTPTALVGWLVALLRRKRVLLLVECDPRFRGVSPKPLITMIKRCVALSSNAVLTSNQHGHRYLRDVLRLPEAHIMVGPYLTSDPGVGETKANPGSHRVHFLFLNTVSQRKGVTQLIDAFSQIPNELRGRWALRIVGSGDQDELVRDLVHKYDLSANVAFHGRVPHAETPRFYAETDIVVCPTMGDYRSLAGIEAVNAGRGVIVSTKDGATEEILLYSSAAWQVDPADVHAFTETLTNLIRDQVSLTEKLIAAQTPPKEFSLSVVGDNLERALDRALE